MVHRNISHMTSFTTCYVFAISYITTSILLYSFFFLQIVIIILLNSQIKLNYNKLNFKKLHKNEFSKNSKIIINIDMFVHRSVLNILST